MKNNKVLGVVKFENKKEGARSSLYSNNAELELFLLTVRQVISTDHFTSDDNLDSVIQKELYFHDSVYKQQPASSQPRGRISAQNPLNERFLQPLLSGERKIERGSVEF